MPTAISHRPAAAAAASAAASLPPAFGCGGAATTGWRCLATNEDDPEDTVVPRLIAGLPLALTLLRAARQRITRLAVALRDAALLFVAEAEFRNVDLWDRDGHEILSLSAEQLAL